MSVPRIITPNYSQQDATFLGLFTFTDALHVQAAPPPIIRSEHITVHKASGISNPYRLLAATVEERE
jgi:hypothetical protein